MPELAGALGETGAAIIDLVSEWLPFNERKEKGGGGVSRTKLLLQNNEK